MTGVLTLTALFFFSCNSGSNNSGKGIWIPGTQIERYGSKIITYIEIGDDRTIQVHGLSEEIADSIEARQEPVIIQIDKHARDDSKFRGVWFKEDDTLLHVLSLQYADDLEALIEEYFKDDPSCFPGDEAVLMATEVTDTASK